MADQGHLEWANEQGPRGNVREAVALFDTEEDMLAAVDDLETHGFAHAAISRPAGPDKVEEAIHHKVEHVEDLEDDSKVPRQAFMDPDSRVEGLTVLVVAPAYVFVLVSAGIAAANGLEMWLSIGISLALGVFGALIGGVFVNKFSKKKIARLLREKEWGGLLLWVRTGNNDQEKRAVNILRSHAGRDVHLHGPAHV